MTNEPTPETDPIFRDNVPDDAQIAALLFCERLEIQRNAARAERDALRAALDEYGEHQGVCPKKYHGMKDSRPCTCGLAAALATSTK